MFSMSALALNLDVAALARLGVLQGTEALLPSRSVLGLGWPELEQALPDRGLPRGVIEIAALPRLGGNGQRARGSLDKAARAPESMRGGATTIAIAAIRAVHAADEKAWCAWITPSETSAQTNAQTTPSLYAPALARANVDLDRLLVVRPSPRALARTVVKVAASGAFDLLIVDVPHLQDLGSAPPAMVGERRGAQHPIASRASLHGREPERARVFESSLRSRSTRISRGESALRWDGGALVVRKLALAAEEAGTTSLLLTSALAERSAPWPVALRLEVERRPDALSLRVTKDRRGCASSQHVVRLAS
jgi:hypothetical protein